MAILGFICKMLQFAVLHINVKKAYTLFWHVEHRQKTALQMYMARTSKVLFLMFLFDLARINTFLQTKSMQLTCYWLFFLLF